MIQKFLPNIKLIHFYIIKEFFASFLFGIAVFSVLLLLDRIFDLVSLFLSKGVSIFMLIELFAYIYPSILPFAIPMSILFAVLLSYGRLSEDNEITAMKANSMGYKTLTMPVIILVGIISFLLIFFNAFVAPYTQQKVKVVFQEMLTQKPLASFSEKTVLRLHDYTFYVNKVDRKRNLLEGVSIYKFDEEKDAQKAEEVLGGGGSSGARALSLDSQNVTWRISASSATIKIYKSGVLMTLYAGFWQKANSQDLRNMMHLTFNSYSFFISLAEQIDKVLTTPQEINSLQLLENIKTLKKENESYAPFAVEFWTRFLFATAPLAFVLIAIPIGMMSGKGGKAIGFGLSIGLIVVYYMLLIIAMHVAEKNYIYAWIILWFPNAFMALCGVFMFAKMVRR
ncbi:MAG: LptF/LptG family permease [Elusimicrobiota bacterium]|jgi:lipopolysaccharide export system permease protein|nr:LptF/LptG family permease [Elusimicrobiota bacterium]